MHHPIATAHDFQGDIVKHGACIHAPPQSDSTRYPAGRASMHSLALLGNGHKGVQPCTSPSLCGYLRLLAAISYTAKHVRRRERLK